MLLGIIQSIGIFIPFAGIVALLRRDQFGKSSVHLLLASLGCMIMNCGYLLFIISGDSSAAMTALKVEYLGSALFYFFFVLFLLSYLKVNMPKIIVGIWGALECTIAAIYWEDTLRSLLFGDYSFAANSFGCMTAQIEQSTLYLIRYSALCAVLLAGLLYGVWRMFRAKLPSERQNIAKLIGAQFVVLVSLVFQLLANPVVDTVPMFAALSILSVVISVHIDGFFGVTDYGHEWVFRQMDTAYIIVDRLYGYLDANASARALFPELDSAKSGERISEELHAVFLSGEDTQEISGKFYDKQVTEIIHNGAPAGYSILLQDITAQQKHTNLVEDYNVRLEAEVAEKTKHIQLVQDSIITGIASVVESRDNSTGGHINRTSAVVRILARKLLESPEFDFSKAFLDSVIKVAPMHDLGKVAVDDVVLRKPGKFTDEEYAKMKAHSAEGARVLEKVLAEVDDALLTTTAVNVAHFHHERWDGKGYPDGLAGEAIPPEARIMALADVFDALVSKRCYKEAFSFDEAFRIVEEGLGTQFDPALGRVFLSCRGELEALYSKAD